jgi:integrase
MAALKRMFRIGMYATPPKVFRLPKFPKLTENNIRTGFLEDAQYKKLITYCSDLWFQTIVEMGRTYGWRISELLNLKAGQVDVNARTIRLEPGTTKNKDGREVTMTSSVLALLTQCVAGKSAQSSVFTRPDGKPVRDFRETWRNACKSAGVPDLLFHDLRRTAARNLRRAGIAEGVIMKIGGWRTRSVFDFGILKWPTSAVCFGPPWVERTSSLDLSEELGSGGGSWTGEPRWNCTSRSDGSMSLAQARSSV